MSSIDNIRFFYLFFNLLFYILRGKLYTHVNYYKAQICYNTYNGVNTVLNKKNTEII